MSKQKKRAKTFMRIYIIYIKLVYTLYELLIITFDIIYNFTHI